MITEQQGGHKAELHQSAKPGAAAADAGSDKAPQLVPPHREDIQANAAANFGALKATPTVAGQVSPTETNAAQIFLENLYLTTKKKAEKRGEHPGFEALRQRLETIVSPLALQDLEKAFAKAAQAKDGLGKATLSSIEERISNVTSDKGMLELVIRQLSGEDISVSEDKADEFYRVHAAALSALQQDPAFQAAHQGSLEYQRHGPRPVDARKLNCIVRDILCPKI